MCLNYEAELVVDGRKLDRPVNYGLVRIVPPAGVEVDPTPTALCDHRSARRPRSGDRRLQSRQRDRRRAQGRAIPVISSVFCPIRCLARRSRTSPAPKQCSSRKVIALHPRGRRQTVRDRQLPGRLGGDDARGPASRSVRADHHRRLAAVLLGGRARQKSDALHRRAPRRQLADGLHQRSGRRQIRRRLAGAEFRKSESGQYALEQAVQPVFQDRHRGAALSRLRALVGRPCQSQRRGDPVHRR